MIIKDMTGGLTRVRDRTRINTCSSGLRAANYVGDGNPLEILYNYVDDKTINVFHAMKCRNIYYHLIPKEEENGKNDR